MNSSEVLVRLHQVELKLDTISILNNINMELHKNSITTIIGPNGAGKTSLIKIILGLLKPTSGELWKPPSLQVGYMPQKLHINPTLPLNVKRFLACSGCTDKQKMLTALASVGASSLFENSIHSLSGGEMQRVLLARAVLRKPKLLVLDEPAQGVDVNGQLSLYKLITDIRDELDCAVLMVSHDLHLVMAATEQVICLNKHICCCGHPEAVTTNPAFTELFGSLHSPLAVYHHHHHHQHYLHGNILSESSCADCNREESI